MVNARNVVLGTDSSTCRGPAVRVQHAGELQGAQHGRGRAVSEAAEEEARSSAASKDM